MKNNDKERLFEVMKKTNPDFKFKLDEQVPITTQQPSDVKAMAKTLQIASKPLKNINSPSEFPEAFRVWFSSLGFTPEANTITISKVRTDVERIMKELGYK